MIKVQNLSKSFGPKLAVNNISFTVERGEVLGFLGPNGAGKSTPMPRACAEIAFNKSKADGVNLYSQRGTETSFNFFARDTESPCLDNRSLLAAGQPEVRKYKAVYVLGDDEGGLDSDVVESVWKA